MRFKQITDQELLKYIENEMPDDEREEYISKKNIKKMLKTLKDHANSVESAVDELEFLFDQDEPNSFFIKKQIDKISDALRKSVGKIYSIGLYSGFINKEDRKEIVSENLIFTKEDERLHIVFPNLLPRRITDNSSPLTWSDVKQMYEKPFYDYFCNGKHRMHTDKVMIIYTMIFADEKEFIDVDNFQTKEITDLITSWITTDDNPKHCAILMDHRRGEYSHTEIDVIPYEKYKGFLE